MALRFERRHQTYRTWYHKRIPSGTVFQEQCCLEFLEAGNPELDYLAGDGCLEFLLCGTPAPSGDCPTLPVVSTLTAVTWDAASFFAVTQAGATLSKTSPFPPALIPNYQCIAYTTDAITANGQGFQFEIPNPTSPGVIIVGLLNTPASPVIDCGSGSVIIGSACGWLYFFPWFLFSVGLGGLSVANAQTDSSPPTSSFAVTGSTVYNIIRCDDRYCLYTDNVLRKQSQAAGPIFSTARLIVWTDFTDVQEPSVSTLITNAFKMTGITCP